MDNGRGTRRPRRPAPWQSYVPFYAFCGFCLLLLALFAMLASHLAGSGHVAAPAATATATLPAAPSPLILRPTTGPLVVASAAAHGATASPTPAHAGSSVQVSSLPRTQIATGVAQVTPGHALPSATPHRTPTPVAPAVHAAQTNLVVARVIDGATGLPREVSQRFVSPALYLYVVATVHHVRPADVLHFVFYRDGVRMPNNDITYAARVTASVHRFSAFADANDQETAPLPRGNYRVLFYRNGRLEATASFRVG